MITEPVSGNVYWTDGRKRTVEVMSLHSLHRAVLYHEEDGRPFDIIAIPEIRYVNN